MARNASGVGSGILYSRKLGGRSRTALATAIITGATPDPGARIGWSNLILTLSNAFVRTHALVLVRFHQISHPHDFATDNDAVVRRVCVAVLPSIRATVYDVYRGEERARQISKSCAGS